MYKILKKIIVSLVVLIFITSIIPTAFAVDFVSDSVVDFSNDTDINSQNAFENVIDESTEQSENLSITSNDNTNAASDTSSQKPAIETNIAIEGLLDNTLGDFFTSDQLIAYVLGGKNYPNNAYLSLQGGCTDGEYFYFGFTIKIRKPDRTTEQIDVRILSCIKTESGEYIPIAVTSITGNSSIPDTIVQSSCHAGDITYNSVEQILVITYADENYHNVLLTVPTSEFKGSPTPIQNPSNGINYEVESISPTFTYKKISCMATTIDFDAKHNQYIVGSTNHLHYYYVLDRNFDLVKTIGIPGNQAWDTDQEANKMWERQGMYCDGNYIYSLNHIPYVNPPDASSWEHELENRLVVYSIDGNYKKTYTFSITKTTYCIYEAECIMNYRGKLVIGFVVLTHTGNRDRFLIELDPTGLYCTAYYSSNSTVSSASEIDTSINSIFINTVGNNQEQQSGPSHTLVTIPSPMFYVHGKRFVNWTLYLPSVNKWLCTDGSWHSQAAIDTTGYIKRTYSAGETVILPTSNAYVFCAQWVDDGNFYVDFVNTKDKETSMPTETVVHGGNGLTLSITAFGDNCAGLNAYWPERNLWLYTKLDGTKEWLADGSEKIGAKKYLYTTETIKATVYPGSHVEMHTVWKEIFVYYNANGAIINQTKVKAMQTVSTGSVAANTFSLYTQNDLWTGGAPQNITFSGYRLYYPLLNRTFYVNPTTGKTTWAATCPSGYTEFIYTGQYIQDIKVPAGDKVVLIACT